VGSIFQQNQSDPLEIPYFVPCDVGMGSEIAVCKVAKISTLADKEIR
jgi:hypothetical protein